MAKELPGNWVETNLKTVLDYQKGKKPKKLSEIEFEGSVPYLDIKAFEKGEIRRYADIESSNLIYPDQLGIVWDGARSGWVTKGKYGAVGSTIAILKPKIINEDFTFHFLRSKYDYINSNTRGTGIPHVDPQILWNINFPLPPLPEQTRITAKLDRLFGQLKNMEESLEKIPLLLKNFRQQVLTQAVTGKLLGKSNFTTLGNLDITIKTGPFGSSLHKSEYIENGIPVINPSHILNGQLIPNQKITISEKKAKELNRWILSSDDIILGRRGEMGRCALYKEKYGTMICGTGSLVLKSNSKINPAFLNYFLRSTFCISFLESNSVGSTMVNLNQKIIKSLPFPDLTIEDQIESIKHLDSLFSKADAIQEKYEILKAKTAQLPQAILHQAFQGKLVPQLESDGDAKELLKEIEALKQESNTKTKKAKPKKYKTNEVALRKAAEEASDYKK